MLTKRLDLSPTTVNRYGRAAVLRWTAILGFVTAAVWIAATLAGSLLDSTYSQISQPVSDLTATDATTWAALAPLYLLYNLTLGGFAIGLHLAQAGDRLWKFGVRLLLLNVVAGVMMVTLFREDLGLEIVTSAGAGHVIFAGISSVVIVIGSFVFGFAFRRSAEWRRLARFSFAVGIGFTLFGPVTAAAAAGKSDLAGLAERLLIGLFLIWVTTVSAFAYRLSRQRVERAPAMPAPVV